MAIWFVVILIGIGLCITAAGIFLGFYFTDKEPVEEGEYSNLDHIGGVALGASVDPQAWKR